MARRKFRQCPREKHGMSKTREYRAWSDMITRCTNPNFIKWEYYGGKGIKVCARWLSSFLAFYEDMGKCPLGHTLDRTDSTKDYEPGNCEWKTQAEQMRNTSRTRLIEFNDRTQCLTDWAIEYGHTHLLVYKRLKRGWDIEKALTTPSTRMAANDRYRLHSAESNNQGDAGSDQAVSPAL